MSNETTNATQIVTLQDAPGLDMMAALMNTQQAFFSSINDDGTRESRAKIYNAVNKAEEKVDDHKGEVLQLVDVVAHPITLTDENTGELVDTVRTVLIMEDGKSYEAVSQGIVSSLSKLFAVVGKPTYNPPLAIKIVEQKTRKGFKTNTIELV